MFVPFDPAPPTAEAPAVFPSPFGTQTVHPWARRAAAETQAWLRGRCELPRSLFTGPVGGKMIGVLVVREAGGKLGYLRAFAGTLGDAWVVDGFVPPAFDVARFESIWSEGGAEVTRLDAQVEALKRAQEPDSSAIAKAVEAQRQHSRQVYAALHGTYRIQNARGGTRPLRELFAPRLPPGGTGDCAGPKLLAHAYARGLRPLAMAEFWWGDPPRAGGRQEGTLYPACRGRCGVLLPFMLEGIPCEPAPDVGMREVGAAAPAVVYEDPWILVVEKPSGMLSVPGRGPSRLDSAQYRLQSRFGSVDEQWPRLAHRLDLATSGLLVAARDRDALVDLQRQFSERAVDKRYVAILEGEVAASQGRVELALRTDVDERPRQIHDPIHGKPAVTRWNVVAREPGGRVRVELFPETGRTHQLRLHAAHAQGIGAPIVGDELYGFGGKRLLLHAEHLAFRHPNTGESMRFNSPAPF